MKYLVIGSGVCGVQAAETIRRYDPDSPITLVGGETFLPYCRPMITLVLGGKIRPEQMVIRDQDFFTSFRIQPVAGEWVQQIDLENRQVVTDKGKSYSFDRLLIATGANPKRIELEGADLKNVFYLRSEAHVEGIAHSLASAKTALVLGCGLVGLKAALELFHRGLQVTVVEKLSHPLPVIVDEKAGKTISRHLEKMGIKVITNVEITALGGKAEVKEALLSDGSRIPCDVVISAIGVQSATEFVPTGSIRVNDGILVNQYLETTVPGIYAAGDVAESFDIAHDERRVNAIWPVAVEQGVIAGMNMAGRKVLYQGSVGRNVFRIDSMDIVAGGIVNPSPSKNYEICSAEDYRRGTYRRLVFRDEIPVGFLMVNDIEQAGVFLSLIQRKIAVNHHKERLMDPSFNFKQLLPSM